ncbi:MAG: TIGR02147 family protein [Fibrobacteria bacterium]|nr:TIGR02147 family protein [Fibrobacteria bacterium]
MALNRSPNSVLDERQYRYHMHWWTGALRALLAIEDHGDDWERLAASIRPQVAPGQARKAVELLHELGLVEKRRGFWKPTASAISSGDDADHELVRGLQIQQFDLARLAIMTEFDLPKDVSTNTRSISAEAFEQVRRRIKAFRSEVRSIVHKDGHPVDRVYGLCLAFFPFSRKPARRSTSNRSCWQESFPALPGATRMGWSPSRAAPPTTPTCCAWRSISWSIGMNHCFVPSRVRLRP